MGRKLRYLPDDNHLVEVTCRVIQRRFLLRPSPTLNAIVIGALARFQQRYEMRICGLVYLSNHCHLLLRPRSVEQLASFMRDVNSKIAREAGRLYGWREKIWSRRYTDIVTSHEPEAQIARLRYLLEQGCKEGLVASPRHWPGASSVRALLSGDSLEGIWIDRTAQFRAGERGEPTPDARFTSRLRLELSPLPCWDELTPPECQTKIRAMVREIENEMEGVEVLGKQAICEQDPHDRPTSRPHPSPAPRFHALAPQVRRALEIGYHLFCRAYRQAFEDWRVGKTSQFPAGCFAPGRFVPLRI
jgi:REP element-mobilizing transposase RayT